MIKASWRAEAQEVARPWLTIIVDDYSRAIAGYFLSFSAPSAFATALALRRAIRRNEDPHWQVCGSPDIFYTDHGSDFTSRHIEQVAADLKMQLVFSLPGAPRGRGRVERFFSTVNQLLLCQLPGYTPPCTTSSASQRRGSALQPTPWATLIEPLSGLLTLPELDARFRAWLLDNYHQRVHSETGIAPQARWEATGFLPRLPASLEHLGLLLLTVIKARRVHQDGIYFQGYRYLDLTLAAYVGEYVNIRYDPRDMAEVRVYHRDAFLCRAICPELAGHTISLKEIVRARNQRRRQL